MRKMMLTILMSGCVIFSTLSFSPLACAQEVAKDHHPEEAAQPMKWLPDYRLEFTVREMEGAKRLNSRNYTMLVQEGTGGMIRVGNRVPYTTGKDQFQYFDVGMNIDLSGLREVGDRVVMHNLRIEISGVAKDEVRSEGNPNPVLRQTRTSITAAIPVGKPTVVIALDDVSSNRRYEVEVTATKVK